MIYALSDFNQIFELCLNINRTCQRSVINAEISIGNNTFREELNCL